MFSGWQDGSERAAFDRLEAARRLQALDPDELVLVHGDQITAVDVDDVGTATRPTSLQLLALRDYDNRPVDWGPGAGAGPINMLRERYPADITHVALWGDNVVAQDVYPNAPGLSRLSIYLRERTDQRVRFTALYDPTVLDQLDDLEGVRAVTYGIHSHEKVETARQAGLLEAYAPPRFNPSTTPSLTVTLGISRNGPRDQFLDPDVSDEILGMAERAEQLFDALRVRGRSRTLKTPSGKPKTVELNLLSQRVQVQAELPRAPEGGNLAARPQVYGALRDAKRDLADVLQGAVDAALLVGHS
ncbi:MAG: hypothetical protein JWN32_1917 [Solirubrobacterales bacterium]|nr:hypothetical protein [Solirubrobacterales bacterium]